MLKIWYRETGRTEIPLKRDWSLIMWNGKNCRQAFVDGLHSQKQSRRYLRWIDFQGGSDWWRICKDIVITWIRSCVNSGLPWLSKWFLVGIYPKTFSLFTMKLFIFRISISIDRRFVFFEESWRCFKSVKGWRVETLTLHIGFQI